MHHNILALAAVLSATGASSQTIAPREIHAPGNPIISKEGHYSADPAPIVIDGTLHVLGGHDQATPRDGGFVMNEWQLFSTRDVEAGDWHHYPGLLRPERLFTWAEAGHAYASQIVRGPDGRFYLYASVAAKDTPEYSGKERSVIGVAVSDHVTGPWRDAHPDGPIISQLLPFADKMINIDPTVLIDDDGRIYMYWGTFGELRGVELERDMVTPKGPVATVDSLQGFFEAPWIMKRGDTYYMLYAGNNAGPDSPCTPAVYHACQAYGTAPSPLGPWTYRGVILKPVSSTTSHAGAVEFEGQWYLVYHTADADGGGHFRRSVAIDELEWDDSVSPPRIKPVAITRRPQAEPIATRNVAQTAVASASNEPIPVQYWIKALNDGIVRETPLPPDMWATWTPENPPRQWIRYQWAEPVTVNGSRIRFWADQPAGANAGVALPRSWRIDYWTGTGWAPVENPSGYPTSADGFQTVRFDPVTTRCVRATFDASGGEGAYAAVAVQEWEVLAPEARKPGRAPVEGEPVCGK